MALAKFLIIGLDGATLDLIDPWAAEGRLPNLERLLKQGSSGVLLSTIPPATFPAWSSFMTGMNPGKHGIFDFSMRKPYSYEIRFVNASYRAGKTLWTLLSEAGKRVGVMAVPCTYPPEKVRGFMISGFDAPVTTGIDPSFVYPRELYREIRERVGPYKITDFQELRIGGRWHERAFPKILTTLERKIEIARYLLKKGNWDCFMVLFGESDTVAHHFWIFHDPRSPRYDPQGAVLHGEAIFKVYRRLDEAVGELLSLVPDDTPVLLLSDHGFGGAGDAAVCLNRWLEEEGYLKFTRRGGRGGFTGLAKRIGLSLLPSRVQEQFFRRFDGWIAHKLESRVRFAGIEWGETAAFSEELNYSPSVWINVKGRDPQGIVGIGKPYEDFRCEVINHLQNFKDPRDGGPIVKRAYLREELYHGPFVERAPDIVLELNLRDSYSYTFLPSLSRPGGSPFRILKPREFPGAKGKGMNGTHRREGFFCLKGKRIREGMRIEASIMDLAPTILHLMNLAVPGEMDGRILEEVLL